VDIPGTSARASLEGAQLLYVDRSRDDGVLVPELPAQLSGAFAIGAREARCGVTPAWESLGNALRRGPFGEQ
jgi:hypothetical protein